MFNNHKPPQRGYNKHVVHATLQVMRHHELPGTTASQRMIERCGRGNLFGVIMCVDGSLFHVGISLAWCNPLARCVSVEVKLLVFALQDIIFRMSYSIHWVGFCLRFRVALSRNWYALKLLEYTSEFLLSVTVIYSKNNYIFYPYYHSIFLNITC